MLFDSSNVPEMNTFQNYQLKQRSKIRKKCNFRQNQFFFNEKTEENF